ncbi:hypothetical protein AUEXF2481DRAFT_553934 [Aureobasidium subglaciale EXF-2481]|uniref:Major facilitator superfamily (MFS) profile domain-containing protein n=1 Tax=Aureobasidium subglaciale (strain EXF-2481) TaxID=1043005 RepID=A0A074YJ96_AURSE|nr:uncharacterized protein AUEXF2481DRAFT_553934 [Aureobasidium subglaciale EXF-2481]KEQ97893.1 hypothetical protein AUEXF2481DRAFT_553934 [Aureobasidium subglaciale EXF-2481]
MATTNKKQPERRLPVQQMCVLALARIAEPIAFTSVLPYLPEMIESLGVPEAEVARWAGICVSMFPLAQFLTAVSWGRASDRYGRKPVILLSLTCTMITSLLWGFSSSLGMAIAIRALAGAANGTVGIIRTAVAEMVPYKELQPRAFSVMPLVWNIGSIFGPTLGGALANPYHVKPGELLSDHPRLFERFPYALPNMLAVILFVTGITIGTLFLEETLAAKKDRRDYGLELGLRLKYYTKQAIRSLRRIITRADDQENLEREPLLKPQFAPSPKSDEEANTLPKPALPPPGFREVLNHQTIINLVVYTLLALHNIAFDQLIPIFMHHPVQDHSASNPDFQPPLKFAGGFGLDSSRIGFIFTLYGISGMFVQFLVFPPVARKYGVVRCLRVCAICMPVIYFFVPFVALLPDRTSQEVAIFIVMVVKGFFSTFAFPCSTILLTNSASSLRILGTLNGIATSVGAVGRALGPAIGGSTFTYGVKIGYIILPWWVLSFIATLAAVPSFWVVEGEGFGGDTENVQDDDESSIAQEDDEEEVEYGSPGPLLTRTDTISSIAISENEREYDSDDTARGNATSPQVRNRRASGSNRLSRRPSRKMSAPIGMENRTISRKFSSNLGQSFGSAGSYNL